LEASSWLGGTTGTDRLLLTNMVSTPPATWPGLFILLALSDNF